MSLKNPETNKEYRIQLARNVCNCCICPFNRGENKKRTPHKSWKSKRKYKHWDE